MPSLCTGVEDILHETEISFSKVFGEIHLNNELPENKREILKKLQALFEPVDNHMSGLIER